MRDPLVTSDGTPLFLHEWPAAEPRLAVALLHGYGEHAGRYRHMAEVFNARGLSVFAVDLRGHGHSGGGRGHVSRFSDYHRDVDALLEATQARAGGLPVALMGHSMGALLAYHYLLFSGKRPNLAGLVLSSPYLGLSLEVHPIKAGLGRVMSRFHPTLALPTGLMGKDVCRDLELQRLYDSDPLNVKKATARWFTETTRAIEEVHGRAGALDVPLLLLYGGADKVASADATERFARALTMKDRTTERLANHYHELVNEPPAVRAPIIARMADWLRAHAEVSQAART